MNKDTYENPGEYYRRISVQPYVQPFIGPTATEIPLPEIKSAIELNMDMEPALLQATEGRTKLIGDTYSVLTFVHFSDVHAVQEMWDRISEYVNHYRRFISFCIHTGDYCGGFQEHFRDLYSGVPCVRPIINCTGNHDTINRKHEKLPKEMVWNKLFMHADNWGGQFMDIPFPTSWYRDFPESNIRLITLDPYYDIAQQCEWLTNILHDAKENNLAVITAMHEPTGKIVINEDVSFQTLTDYAAFGFYNTNTSEFDRIIGNFIQHGGQHICHLAGHYHSDHFGFTENGVLNIVVECASDWAGLCDGKRMRGTRTFDCFNIVCVDVNLGLIKLIRIGDNLDYLLRSRKTLCYDYRNRKVISNS